MSKSAVVLLSGGLDSTTCLAYAINDGYDVSAISFDYSQKHIAELEAAKKIAHLFRVKEHKIIKLDCSAFSKSALIDNSINVQKHGHQTKMSIPSTYVPARNTIFLSYGLGFAEIIGANTLVIGANAIDYSGYPDCRPEYLTAFEAMANLATKSAIDGTKIKLLTPIINLTKAEIIKLGHSLGVDYSYTVSCYKANDLGQACGECDSCFYRKKGFKEAGIPDPTPYYNK